MDITEWMRESWLDLLALTEDWIRTEGKELMSEQQYKPGDLIWWSDKWVCSGYYPPIKAMFVKYYRSRVGIAVQLRSGEWIPKKVTLQYIEKRDSK